MQFTKHIVLWSIKLKMSRSLNKTFKIDYNPLDVEGYQYHVDISVPFTQQQQLTVTLIPGINKVRHNRYHCCFQSGSLVEITHEQIINDIITVITGFDYKNAGWTARELIDRHRMMEQDPNSIVIENVRKRIATDLDRNCNLVDVFGTQKDLSQMSSENLEKNLHKAVHEEDYLLAAKLRDELGLKPKK